ncbi:MAG: hypothetical protein E3J35_09335 [Methanomassiliicoccales archaeon]|nr:MAG: hypothetical protein E3J35_09335 [Methanomassiliicoccales archaeon]
MRNCSNAYIAMNDNVDENRITGAFLHTIVKVPVFGDVLFRHLGWTRLGEYSNVIATTQEWIDSPGILDGHVILSKSDSVAGCHIYVEVKREGSPDDRSADSQGSEKVLEILEEQQLIRYLSHGIPCYGDYFRLLYVTNDIDMPSAIETAKSYSRNRFPDFSTKKLVWTSWSSIHELLKDCRSKGKLDEISKKLLGEFIEFLEVRNMVVDKLTDRDIEMMDGIPDEMWKRFTHLDKKSKNFRDALLDRIQTTLGIKGVNRLHSKKYWQIWKQIRLRENEKCPLCVEVAFSFVTLQLTVSLRFIGNWEPSERYLRWLDKNKEPLLKRLSRLKNFDPQQFQRGIKAASRGRYYDSELYFVKNYEGLEELRNMNIGRVLDDVKKGLNMIDKYFAMQ